MEDPQRELAPGGGRLRLSYKRLDDSLPAPAYQTGGAAGFDLYARTAALIPPGRTGLIPANLIVEVPKGHALLVALRSSTPLRKGLIAPHGVGVVDSDYRGPEDELKVLVYNPTPNPVPIARGERIAQAFVVATPVCELVEQDRVTAPSRGGFGSTGS